jgi:hypothetical protein
LESLWAGDGVHRLEAPEEMQTAALALGFRKPALEARGYDDLELRISQAYADFVAPGAFTFRRSDDVSRVGDAIKFHWEMINTATGDVAAVGLEILIVDGDLQIRDDYQFIER